MGSLGNPKTWVPYLNNKDCSQGFCSLYCPQWCYIIYPPPPPPPRAAATSASISPLTVAIIGVLASAFLLVAYYVLISKLCGRRRPNERTRLPSSSSAAANEDSAEPPPPHEAWHVTTAGLDEAAIAAIEVRKYRRNGGGAENCSVCLSEFGEEESVRLLPKCEHAFHVPCIDTWLRSHSNCPLCRAAVVADCCLPEGESSEMMAGEDSGDDDRGEAESVAGDLSAAEKSGGEDSSSSRGSELERHAVIEVRRSVSMDFSPARDGVSVAENDLMIGTDCDCEEQDHRVDVDQEFGNHGKVNGCGSQRRKGVLHCVVSPVVMKRSVSSGRFFLRRNSVIPL